MSISQAQTEHPFTECKLCPRACGIDRRERPGVCGQTARIRIASMGAHYGEEPPISGSRGSGTVFFAGCSCRCFFCQNYQISLQGGGDLYSYENFLQAVIALAQTGVHNINFVTPDHYWPCLIPLKGDLRSRGVDIPLLYNTSSYMHTDAAAQLTQCFDIFLPDYKYDEPDLAREVIGDSRYPELALAAIKTMVDAKGFLDSFLFREPVAAAGVLVRHLILPGHVENSLRALDRLYDTFGPGLPLSVMSQYLPVPGCAGKPPFDRRITAREYETVIDKVERLGFSRVFIQELHGDDTFMPDFERDEPFEGNAL